MCNECPNTKMLLKLMSAVRKLQIAVEDLTVVKKSYDNVKVGGTD